MSHVKSKHVGIFNVLMYYDCVSTNMLHVLVNLHKHVMHVHPLCTSRHHCKHVVERAKLDLVDLEHL